MKILERISKLPHKTFFIQTKQPFDLWEILCKLKIKGSPSPLPPNLILGITLETNRDKDYNEKISQAPYPSLRAIMFEQIEHTRKFITIEPILDFDLDKFIEMIHRINPERVYIGYDTKKNKLPEPKLEKTLQLIEDLKKFTIVKTKLIRSAWNE